LVYKEELDALAKSSQLHDTNSVVALVQKYGMMLENIQINAVCIPAEY
jgi:hypothetical protein